MLSEPVYEAKRRRRAVEGGVQKELTSSCTYYVPVSTLCGCPLHLIAGERAARVIHVPNDT